MTISSAALAFSVPVAEYVTDQPHLHSFLLLALSWVFFFVAIFLGLRLGWIVSEVLANANAQTDVEDLEPQEGRVKSTFLAQQVCFVLGVLFFFGFSAQSIFFSAPVADARIAM